MNRKPVRARRMSTAANLADLSSLGPASATWLTAAGITSVAELKRVGAAEAFGRVRYNIGRAATRNFLYALEAAILDVHWTAITDAQRIRLCAEAGIGPPKILRGRRV